MKTTDYEQLYRAVPLFATLDPAEIDEIMAVSHLFKSPKDCVILEEGQPGHGMYVIVHGMVTCRMRLFQGDDTHLANLYKGDVFGEMSLIDDGPVSATITTISECILYHVEKEKFDALRRQLRPAAFKVLRATAPTICERLRAINMRIGAIFSEPHEHLEIMQRRYAKLAQVSKAIDAPTE